MMAMGKAYVRRLKKHKTGMAWIRHEANRDCSMHTNKKRLR
jgi:hypothetical protein